MMTVVMSSTSPITTANSPSTRPSVRSIPGSYGWPVVGPLTDRLDYFWFKGQDEFFRKRVEKHKSPVFRTNVPPCFPFFAGVNPNVIAVLDCKSFSALFDMDRVEKKNVLVGDFMPSVAYTGDTRVCAYLDTLEDVHAKSDGTDVGSNSQSQTQLIQEKERAQRKLVLCNTYYKSR